jgi:hypothetical protein
MPPQPGSWQGPAGPAPAFLQQGPAPQPPVNTNFGMAANPPAPDAGLTAAMNVAMNFKA